MLHFRVGQLGRTRTGGQSGELFGQLRSRADRVKEFDNLLNKYNGKEFNFDSIKVVSAGDRDPDADDVTGCDPRNIEGRTVPNHRHAKHS